jgi:hypothetical protein
MTWKVHNVTRRGNGGHDNFNEDDVFLFGSGGRRCGDFFEDASGKGNGIKGASRHA